MSEMSYANEFDQAVAGKYEAREADWRNGAISYSVLVDRFAPAADLAAKAHLYPAPKQIRQWHELPVRGHYLADEKVWSHEIDFWGGDLNSVQSRLAYIQGLGVEVLYLNPIVLSFTNHRYDAIDYAVVAPEFGSREDVKTLASDLHGRGMRLVLDGVFNHMGRRSAYFQSAESDPNSPYRDWFEFTSDAKGGARAWWRAENLPELILENPEVSDYIYRGHDSIVRSYLRDGVDGWRLDVAFDIGMKHLAELTASAHSEKPGSLVLGEIANYPKEWFPAVDGLLMFVMRDILLGLADGSISAAHAQRMVERIYAEPGYDHLLKSWIYLDNHDTPRLATTIPDFERRKLALVLLFTLPGAPNLYYGSELGMPGGDDPEMRAPMQWHWVNDENPVLGLTRHLATLHNERRGLKVGDFRPVVTERLFGFERHTDRAADTVIVLVNSSDEEVRERVIVANSKLMDGHPLIDLLDGNHQQVRRGGLDVTMPPRSALVLTPLTEAVGGYTPYKRVQ